MNLPDHDITEDDARAPGLSIDGRAALVRSEYGVPAGLLIDADGRQIGIVADVDEKGGVA